MSTSDRRDDLLGAGSAAVMIGREASMNLLGSEALGQSQKGEGQHESKHCSMSDTHKGSRAPGRKRRSRWPRVHLPTTSGTAGTLVAQGAQRDDSATTATNVPTTRPLATSPVAPPALPSP